MDKYNRMSLLLINFIYCFYLIPFYYLLGDEGGALFGYVYSIYIVLICIFRYLPKIVVEVAKEHLDSSSYRNKILRNSKLIFVTIGIIIFLILFIFSGGISSLIVGDTTLGNSIEDISLVIKTISFAFLVIPTVAYYRSLFSIYQIKGICLVSKLIEEIFTAFLIIIGCFISSKLLHLSITYTVVVAISSIIISNLLTYLYLKIAVYKNRKLLSNNSKDKKIKISNKKIIKKILYCAFPIILIGVSNVLYNFIDVFMITKVLINNFYNKISTESIMSTIVLWGFILNSIILKFINDKIHGYIPSLNNIKKTDKDLGEKINKFIQLSVFIFLPVVFLLSIISSNIWTVIFGVSEYGSSIYSYYVFIIIVLAFFSNIINIIYLLKEYKIMYISLFSGILVKVCLNIPFLYGFNKMGLSAYYGSITATILGYSISTIICLIFLNKKYHVDYEETVKIFIDVLNATLIMTIVLLLIKLYLPISSSNRLINLLISLIYIIIGGIIYIVVTFRNRSFLKIFGNKKEKRK